MRCWRRTEPGAGWNHILFCPSLPWPCVGFLTFLSHNGNDSLGHFTSVLARGNTSSLLNKPGNPGECGNLVLVLPLVGRACILLALIWFALGVFIPRSFCSAVTMHWMDCFPQKCCLVAVMPSINLCEVSVLLGDKWADVWEGMKGSNTAR